MAPRTLSLFAAALLAAAAWHCDGIEPGCFGGTCSDAGAGRADAADASRPDAGRDAGRDGGVDAADAGDDAGQDASLDSGPEDAGDLDAGRDAGPADACVPATCSSSACGTIPGGCGGTLDCGGCATGSACVGNRCICQPQCTGRSCGPDGCGGSCGTCYPGYGCNTVGACVYGATSCRCTGVCGFDGCQGICGVCATTEYCNSQHACVPGCGFHFSIESATSSAEIAGNTADAAVCLGELQYGSAGGSVLLNGMTDSSITIVLGGMQRGGTYYLPSSTIPNLGPTISLLHAGIQFHSSDSGSFLTLRVNALDKWVGGGFNLEILPGSIITDGKGAKRNIAGTLSGVFAQ